MKTNTFITMILIATVTLPLLVYAQIRTPVQTRETLLATPQDAQKAIQEGILGRIASKANNSLRTYSSPTQIRNIRDPKIRSILERGRELLELGQAATRFNATQLTDFAGQVDQYLKEAEAAAISAKPTGATPQGNCGAAKDACNQRCHDRDAGYFCFFDCRLEYLVCLGGTLFTAGGGGVIIR